MLQRVAQDQHPPLYFLCLSGWAAIFGTSEAALRSLSALFGSLTLPIAWIAMRRATTPQTAALCVVFLAVSPKHLRWSQEVRQYALLGLAVWAMLWCAVKCCHRPSRAGWIGLSVAAACVLYTHNSGALFVFATVGAVGAWAVATTRRGVWMGLPVVLLLTALLYLPWLPHLRAQLEAGGPAYLQSAVPSLPGIAAVVWGDLSRFGAADGLDEMSRRLLVLRAASAALVFVSYCLGCWRWSSRGGQGMNWLLIANSIFAVLLFAGVCAMRGGMWSPKALMPAGLCAFGAGGSGPVNDALSGSCRRALCTTDRLWHVWSLD
jgi:4-amino-4-deoxy-L-arabinose transferase-like glycosyltransferase